MSLISTFIGRTKILSSPAPTGRRLHPPRFSGYNLREDPTPQFYGSNQKEDKTPYYMATAGRWLQLPILTLFNCPEI
jgi:hypothetical protein